MELKLLIYMPALNEAETIYNVLESIHKGFEGFNAIELLVVNDGSKDNTEEEAIKAGATVISHAYNKGVGGAFQTAINYALQTNADVLVSIDADGQFDVVGPTALTRNISVWLRYSVFADLPGPEAILATKA